ncbi:MAG: choloylglycine hydrolase [Sarcina sp.]
MCTGLMLETKNGEHLFGRNMDIEFTFGQNVGVIPRNFEYKNVATKKNETTKYGIIAMMTVMDGQPMLADGMNEKGLAIAGLNFPGYSYYPKDLQDGKDNVPVHNFMLWVLSNFTTIEEVRKAVENVNIVDVPFNEKTPNPTLHWILTDKTGKSIVIETTKRDGLRVFDNNVGVLTNSPTFDWHLTNLKQYINMTANDIAPTKWSTEELVKLGVGIGSVGLPGDFTPPSRFVKVAFLRHATLLNDDNIGVSQFFHVLNGVAMVRGAVQTAQKLNDITVYTSCMNLEQQLYYYNTYDNNNISVVDMKKVDLDGEKLVLFPYLNELKAYAQN